jgi:hypothetical protein
MEVFKSAARFSTRSEIDRQKWCTLWVPVWDSPICLDSCCHLGVLWCILNSKAAAQLKSWLSVSNLSWELDIPSLTGIVSACHRLARTKLDLTTWYTIRLQTALFQFPFMWPMETSTGSYHSCFYSCMSFVVELQRGSLSARIFWSLFAKSLKLSRHMSLALCRSLAILGGSIFCIWLQFGSLWIFLVLRKETANFSSSEYPLGNW